ncbi:MAG: hypothetical protein NT011_02535 [Kiritimatiellaeota bacterium]|nr:hypothetical protein [Kiritimatiellota bacterium]
MNHDLYAVVFFCANTAKAEQGTQSRLTGYKVDKLIAHFKLSAARRQAEEILWQI